MFKRYKDFLFESEFTESVISMLSANSLYVELSNDLKEDVAYTAKIELSSVKGDYFLITGVLGKVFDKIFSKDNFLKVLNKLYPKLPKEFTTSISSKSFLNQMSEDTAEIMGLFLYKYASLCREFTDANKVAVYVKKTMNLGNVLIESHIFGEVQRRYAKAIKKVQSSDTDDIKEYIKNAPDKIIHFLCSVYDMKIPKSDSERSNLADALTMRVN